MSIDIVTIIHNETNTRLLKKLQSTLQKYEPDNHKLIVHDNTINNLGFARGCNLGAKQATTDIVGFLNPDIVVTGKFIDVVEQQFLDDDLVITGCTFRKGSVRTSHIGLTNWVCGAAFFVRREWFNEVGGFHEGYMWSWEETDLCRLAESQNKQVRPIELKLLHDRSHTRKDSKVDQLYKTEGMRRGKKLYYERWG